MIIKVRLKLEKERERKRETGSDRNRFDTDKYRTGILYNQLFNNNNNSTLLFLYLWFGVTSINVGIYKVEILIILKIRPLYGFAIFLSELYMRNSKMKDIKIRMLRIFRLEIFHLA